MEPERDYATAKEVRKSRLPLAEQDKYIAELQELVTMLCDRLQPILTPTEPTDKMAEDRATPVVSEHAQTINDHNSRINRVNRRITNVLERLEV